MKHTFSVFCPFGGAGLGARGFQEAEARLFGNAARFELIGGLDSDPAACADFEYLTGVPEWCTDIEAVTPVELRRRVGSRGPDCVFFSPPCKGSSALLSVAKSQTPKYEKMNLLALKWVELMLATWPESPPGLLLLENVPRLKTRAAPMLKKLRSLLRGAGYVLTDGFHDCGELGGLAQRRRRFLLVARLPARVPPLLYQPPKKRVRGCGEVLAQLPLPGDPAGGPMHALPRLSWLNWVRLALIPAGGDWRDLEGVLRDGQAKREVFKRHGVEKWNEPTDTIGGSGSNGPSAVADPRIEEFGNVNRVTPWDQPTGTVTTSPAPSSGSPAVADPRVGPFKGSMGVREWSEPAATVAGESYPSNGGGAVADPRIALPESAGRHWNKFKVNGWEQPVSTIIGASQPNSGAQAVTDPRIPPDGERVLRVMRAYDHGYGVLKWTEPSPTVAGGSAVGQGAYSVADLRYKGKYFADTYGVLSWEDAAATITGNARFAAGKFAVADPRKPPPFTPVIIAADGTWHRPLTTLELAVLQDFPSTHNGEPLVLHGKYASHWRERIGNAVPRGAAKAIAERMLYALLQAALGQTFTLSSGDIWVERGQLNA